MIFQRTEVLIGYIFTWPACGKVLWEHGLRIFGRNSTFRTNVDLPQFTPKKININVVTFKVERQRGSKYVWRRFLNCGLGDFCSFDSVFGSRWDLLCLYRRKTEDDRRVPNGGPEDADTSGRSLYPCVVPDGGADTGSAGGDVHQGDPVLSVVVRTARCRVSCHHFICSAVLSIKTHELFRGIK